MLHCPTCGRNYPPDVQICPEDKTALQADATISTGISADPLIGHTLDDKYRLEERLGIGGMGTVYRARHLLIDRPVAVKVMNQRFVEDEAAKTRFRREAKAAGRLQHTNAVTVTDFGQTADGYVYIVMELLQGRTLREILAKEAPLDTARAVALMLQASAAVAAAHEAGIIHRDLKPANIFVVQRSEVPAQVKVLDFGIAKLAADSLDEEDPKTLTLVGAMIGTPRYMSPEQCDGAQLTPAADVYSLGVILYEMLTGSVPFSGSSPLSIAMKHASEPPRRPREIVTSIPPELEEVILHALEKRPKDRPADASEFGRELLNTAERLGLEHAATTSGPDFNTLRSAGTESPSGRLVIDIARLRDINRAATSSSGDMTVISEQEAAEIVAAREAHSSKSVSSPVGPQSFPRVNVPLGRNSKLTKTMAVALVLIAVALIVGITLFATNSGHLGAATNVNVNASPSPTAEPSPSTSPSPSPSASPKVEERRPKQAASKKNDSGIGGVIRKAGRILTKPFRR